MNNTSSTESASRIVVAAGAAASIEAAAGAAIRCVAGKLWLTQEGDARDYVVPAGTTFCTDRAGRVVVSGVDTDAVVVVRTAAPAHCVRGAVSIDSIERFTRSARAAQAQYMAGLFGRLSGFLARAIKRKAVPPSTSLPVRSGRTQGFRGYVRSI